MIRAATGRGPRIDRQISNETSATARLAIVQVAEDPTIRRTSVSQAALGPAIGPKMA